MMKKIIIILLVSLLSLAGYSQIKRDIKPPTPKAKTEKTDKPAKTATKKNKKKASSKASAKKGTNKTVTAGKKKRGRNGSQESYGQTVEREDPYLYLGGADELDIDDVPVDGASYRLDISTNCEISLSYYIEKEVDGESTTEELDEAPDWISFGYDDENGDYITIAENDTYGTRKCVVVLTTEEGPEAAVNVSQEGKPVKASGDITSAYIRHNQEYKSEKCMEINANFNLYQSDGLSFILIAFLFDENEEHVIASSSYPDFSFPETGGLFVGDEIHPTSSYYSNTMTLVVPNEAIYLQNRSKKQKLTWHLGLYCVEKGDYIARYQIDMVAKEKKGKIVTENN